MKPLVVLGASIVGPDAVLPDADLVVRDGVIAALGPGAGRDVPGATRVQADGLTLWPGLIDLHVHGARGALIGQGHAGDIALTGIALASRGVTRFLPTLPPIPPSRLLDEVARLAPLEPAASGARPLGLHLEGPYLNPQRSGALPPERLRHPDEGEFREILAAGKGRIRLMTLAPELPSALAVIAAGFEAGVVMAAGHTEASYAEMEKAVDAGLRHVTHCCNAMRRVSHRSPGPVEAALTRRELTLDAICDGRHIHKSLFDIMMRCKGPDGIALISDATAFQAPDGAIAFLDRLLEVRQGIVRDPQTGALGGSAITVWDAIRNVKKWLNLPLPALSRLGSLVPARILGQEHELGSLEPGKKADFFLASADQEVKEVYVDGERLVLPD